MNKFKGVLPMVRPDIKIEPLKEVSFNIKINEVTWMYCDTRVGHSTIWGIYDPPDWKLTDCSETETFRKAKIHDIDCVEIRNFDYNSPLDEKFSREYNLFVHADDEMIQYVAKSEVRDGVFEMSTLFDDQFIENYSVEMPAMVNDSGFGIYKTDDLDRIDLVTENDSLLVGGGVFKVTVGDRTFECLRVVNRWNDSPRVLVENYMNRDGRSILFRRYNHPVWKIERYKQRWDEKLPEAKTLAINGEKYIHWYDCLSDIVFK
ncbi:MAG: hypothetical protein J7L77_02305 [Clostridiales bacterium]|nr:hypothetical protein [Clostridiales bacterium]